MIGRNLIIRASAGTGKTFSLATRFLRLMLFWNVPPERIVALTFSRLAAQEIYTKLLERLWNAAMDEDGARREMDLLTEDLLPEEKRSLAQSGFDATPARFAACLRRVIDTQHYGAIATLDSFILRVVRSFPLEMGFQHAVDVLDSYGEVSALGRARAKVLSGRTDPYGFESAFRTVNRDDHFRSCARILSRVLKGWRPILLDHPDARTWTVASMRKALGMGADSPLPDFEGLSATGNNAGLFDKAVARIRDFSPHDDIFPDNGAGKLLAFLWENPNATCFRYETATGREKICECGLAGAAALRDGVRYMASVELDACIEESLAKLVLCGAVEAEYDVSTRKAGLLTFSDFTNRQAASEDAEHGMALQNLEYRFDSKIDHWALDEFQDTSEMQWLCLRRLVREAASDPERSVMAVGDLKQSIYTWRGGNDAPFKEMMEKWPEFRGEQGANVSSEVSFRYGRRTADFINAVFRKDNVGDSRLLEQGRAGAIERWSDGQCWMDHRAAKGPNGLVNESDYVSITGVVPGEDPEPAEGDEQATAAMRILAPAVCAKVDELWKAHANGKSTDTIGILVRSNADGAFLAERLRARNIPVVWEGLDGVMDSPVVRAVLELLKLASHPEDSYAWETVDRIFPIREIVFPERRTASEVSWAVSRDLSRLGLARTLRKIVTKLTETDSFREDPRTLRRLEMLVREGVRYEARAEVREAAEEFRSYLEVSAGRETGASPHVVRILTIHRSKGLTIDHVIVPIPESGARTSLGEPMAGAPLSGDGWALGVAHAEELARVNDAVRNAWTRQADDHLLSQLRMYYVALTRARKSTRAFVVLDAHSDKVQFRDLLLAPFGGMPTEAELPKPGCWKVLYESGTPPAFGRKQEPAAEIPPWKHEPGQAPLERRSPSDSGPRAGEGPAASVSILFSGEFGAAAEKGTQAHAAYAAIGWIDPAAPADGTEGAILDSDWREAFVKTDEAIDLWRECPYEIVYGGVWETGQFDRVVFLERDGVRRAVVYDFKTNAVRDGEAAEAFSARMRKTYAGQMRMYREAVARLAGLPPDCVGSKLLLAATMTVVEVS